MPLDFQFARSEIVAVLVRTVFRGADAKCCYELCYRFPAYVPPHYLPWRGRGAENA